MHRSDLQFRTLCQAHLLLSFLRRFANHLAASTSHRSSFDAWARLHIYRGSHHERRSSGDRSCQLLQQLQGLNHASCKSSLAVGLSLGSIFIISAMKYLSGRASSSSSDMDNGSHFLFSWMTSNLTSQLEEYPVSPSLFPMATTISLCSIYLSCSFSMLLVMPATPVYANVRTCGWRMEAVTGA